MVCFRQQLFLRALLILSIGAASSCKNKGQVVGSDLHEAGFELTIGDWFKASRENNVEALKKFVASGFSKEAKDGAGDTALHAAAAAGAENSAAFLLARGLAVDEKGALGRTPLMAAVMADKRSMVRWLLRQGAHPMAMDDESFKPLMLAVREGSAGAVEELASYDREDLDSALLLAALLGKAKVIDSLTNYGASVYARMGDGRTALMIAAQNGHLDAVNLLLDIGASRQAVDGGGKTAADLAADAGHVEIVAVMNREPSSAELVFESPDGVAAEMVRFVEAAQEENSPASAAAAIAKMPPGNGQNATGEPGRSQKGISRSLEGAILTGNGQALPAGKSEKPPIIMRHYREADVPIQVTQVTGDIATLRIIGPVPREVKVRAGDAIPGSRLVILRVKRRTEDSKLTNGKPMEVSVVEVSDRASGVEREWISGRQSTAHDPVALVEDPLTGQRYMAKPGQRFQSADGGNYRISDVRPNQIIIEDLSDGSVQTVPLSGPRG